MAGASAGEGAAVVETLSAAPPTADGTAGRSTALASGDVPPVLASLPPAALSPSSERRPPLSSPGQASTIASADLRYAVQTPSVAASASPSIMTGAGDSPSVLSSALPSYLDRSTGSLLTSHSTLQSHPPLWLGTASAPVSVDAKQMQEIGYAETLRRDYDGWSLFALTTANIGWLQGALFGAVGAQAFGGSSMLAIGWPVTMLFMCAVAGVMAELASAFPVAGAMMTWTFRLARAIPSLRSSARFLSWLVGSSLLCAHILTQILIAFQFGVVVHGTIRLYRSDYAPGRWPVAVVALGVVFAAGLICCSRISRSPWLWRLVLLEIGVAFLVIIIALGAGTKQPLADADDVFTTYDNDTGFDSAPFVYLIGWVQTCLATGQDLAVHLAEEVKAPARTVPWAIFWSTVSSYAFGWVAICVILAVANSDNFNPQKTPPHNSLFAPGELLTSHLDQGLATTIIILLLVAMFAQNVAQLMASSRYCWALARDNALPFSSWIARVGGTSRIPRAAVLFVVLCTLPGVLLVALVRGVITSVALEGAGITIILAYAVPILLYIKAGSGALDIDGRRQFSLRGASIPLAWVSVLFLGLAVVVFCFPTSSPVDVYTMSWAPVVLAGLLLLSCLSWVLYGNQRYAGPIKAVIGPDVELPRFAGARSQASGGGAARSPPPTGADGGAAAPAAAPPGDKKPSEPGTTQIFYASGESTGGLTSTAWTGGDGSAAYTTDWTDDEASVATRQTASAAPADEPAGRSR